MAVISIPNSIGGLAIPGGLLNGPLGKLFNKNTGKKTLQYPSDLASNPTRAHSVLFTIREITPINNSEKINKTVDNVKNTVSQSIQTSLKSPQSKVESYVSLYMPDTLNMSYSASYQDFSLTDALGVGGKIGSTAISLYEDYKSTGSFKDTAKNLLQGPAAAELTGAALNKFGGTTEGAAVLLKATGQAVNPQLQLLYKGLNLRSFQLDFIFTPKTKSEAQAVKDIIDTFNYHFHPAIGDAAKGNQGQYFVMPSVFNIKFQFTGSDDAKSSVLNSVLGNLGPIGSAISSSLGSTAKENTTLYKVGDCVLEGINVDYAPNGWAAYTDGSPVQTRLTLQFKEMDIVHRGRLTKPGSNKAGDVR